ncbi:MAG: hypothetical protein ABI559_10405 [Chloroflexota bacterium]
MRTWPIGILTLVAALTWWLFGVDGLQVIAIWGWPLAIGALFVIFANLSEGKAALAGAVIGSLPGALLAISVLVTNKPNDPENTRLAEAVIVVLFLAIPNVVVGSAGGILGAIIRPHHASARASIPE